MSRSFDDAAAQGAPLPRYRFGIADTMGTGAAGHARRC